MVCVAFKYFSAPLLLAASAVVVVVVVVAVVVCSAGRMNVGIVAVRRKCCVCMTDGCSLASRSAIER